MKSVYFLSDAHLGCRSIPHDRTRERRLVHFLDGIKDKASAVYLLGDIFDFWYEYKTVVPRGYTRFSGSSANWPTGAWRCTSLRATTTSGAAITW